MRRKVLICGSRNWWDREAIFRRLCQEDMLNSVVMHGGANGADQMAGFACETQAIPYAVMRPFWDRWGKRAGYFRNIAMLDWQPDLVIAYTTGSRGTQHTINEARKRGIPVEVHGTELAANQSEEQQ